MTRIKLQFISYVIDAIQSANICPAYRHAEIAYTLCTLMSGSVRHYHNCQHVVKMFADASRLGLVLTPSEKLAIVFHDAIYDPIAKASENETASVKFMHAIFAKSNQTVRTASNTIYATAHHMRQQPNVKTSAIRILDLDLMGLSYEWKQFKLLTKCLWKEMQAAIPSFNYTEFCQRRAEFLTQLLRRPQLFYSVEFHHLENAARNNIQRWYKTL